MSKQAHLNSAGVNKAEDTDSATKKGTIWKIDRNATHDGPGIRTLLYFKSCPLRCHWCSNPEGQLADPVLIFQPAKCNNCGLCIDACPRQALTLPKPARVRIDRSKCDVYCGECVPACPTVALQIWGQRYSVPEVVELLERDRLIHRKSGGGLSCTGGEPLAQGEFLLGLLDQCRRQGIHTSVETSAYADKVLFKAMLQLVEWLFIDLKHMNPQKHLELTGKSNDIILRNTRLASTILQTRGKALVIRQVVIPNITDGQNITDLADFATSLPFVSGVELLTYHNYGSHKYNLLNRKYGLQEVTPPTAEEMVKYKKVLQDKGLTVI
ncbi:glycyl-radical enzyme activating protein [Chloroflexota bacterium]